MNIFIIITAVLFGTIVGSFLNVVVLRYNTGKSLGGRSGCFSCGKTLSWYELIPVVSFILQKGRCRKCSVAISPLYLGGEITAGITFGLIAARGLFLGIDITTVSYLLGTFFLWIVFSFLLVILWYDFRHKIIPDFFSLLFGGGAFFSLFIIEKSGFLMTAFTIPHLWDFLAGIIVPLPFFLVWVLSKGRFIGLGDPKLMIGIGWLLGIAQGFSAVVLSFWIGAVFVIGIMLINVLFKKRLLRTGKKSIMKTELAFAPFLILATLVTLVWNIHLFIII